MRRPQNGPRPARAEVCSNQAPELTDWPIERISEVVQPTDAQRQALDELRAASAKAIEILQSGAQRILPSIPTGRLSAMESRLQVMLAGCQTVRPELERLLRSLSASRRHASTKRATGLMPTPPARTNAILAKFCDEKVVQRHRPADRPHRPKRSAHADAAGRALRLKDASAKATESLKVSCPAYQMLTPRVV